MFINGEIIREYRYENGISIEDMAKTLAMTPELLDRYENGEPWEESNELTAYVLDILFEDDPEAKYIILDEDF